MLDLLICTMAALIADADADTLGLCHIAGYLDNLLVQGRLNRTAGFDCRRTNMHGIRLEYRREKALERSVVAQHVITGHKHEITPPPAKEGRPWEALRASWASPAASDRGKHPTADRYG